MIWIYHLIIFISLPIQNTDIIGKSLYVKSYLNISESKTVEEFGERLELEKVNLDHFKSLMVAVDNYDYSTLTSLGIKEREIGNVVAFFEKYVIAGFSVKK